MKKIFVCLLLLVVLLTGCSQYHNEKAAAIDSNSNEETGNHYANNGTNVTSDYIYDCEAPGVFANLNDFYKFATSGSRNPEDYIDSYTRENIEWYASVDSNALLKIEDLFNDADIANEVETVYINYINNDYTYLLKSGITVNVKYAPGGATIGTMTDVARGDEAFVREDSKTEFSISSKDDKIYVKEVNGITINRQMQKSLHVNYFSFTTLIDGYKISIETYWADKYSSQDQLLNDPTNQFVKSFLTDSELPEAIGVFKSCIERNKK